MNDFNFIPQGWECPKCKRVYSPSTIMCISCPPKSSINTIDTPIGVGGHGVANGTHVFVPDPITTSVCKVCGKDKSLHFLFNHQQ